MFRLLCDARMFRCALIFSTVRRGFSPFSPPNILTRSISTSAHLYYPLQSPLKMCFRGSSSVESTSSSSSDEPIARVIDLPTVRRLNSPRCATRGNAYNLGGSAASDRTHPPFADHAAAVCAMLTAYHSQEVSTSPKTKTEVSTRRHPFHVMLMNVGTGEFYGSLWLESCVY
jgi:hypothetical protein